MTHTVRPRSKKFRKPPVEAEFELRDWGPRGAVSAELNDRKVLIDLGMPGETVAASVDRRRKPWHGSVNTVIKASPDRVAPLCPYYLVGCGGCQLQHVSYDAQLSMKEASVNREMRLAGLDRTVQRVWSMDHPWRYRRTAAIAIGWEAGFRPRGRRGIIEIRDCPIAHPLIGRLADGLNTVLRAGSIPNYHGKVWIDCTVVGSKAAPALQSVIQGIEGLTLESHPELPEVARELASLDGVQTVAFRHRSGTVEPLVGDVMGTIQVDRRFLHLPAGSFFQANLEMLETLLDKLRRLLTALDIGHMADVYGGVGVLGLSLCDLTRRLTIIELDGTAVEAARQTAAEWGLENVDFISRHAERALPDLTSLDVALVDPPRSGLGQTVVDALSVNGVPTIVYVSCSPSSLACDLAAFVRHGYGIDSLEMFDFYPQTYHVESLAVLTR